MFRPGDRVLQLRNDYDLKVFNGDLGLVGAIDPIEQRIDQESFTVGSHQVAAALGLHAVQLLEDHPLWTFESDACAVAVMTTSEMLTCSGRVATQRMASATSSAVSGCQPS